MILDGILEVDDDDDLQPWLSRWFLIFVSDIILSFSEAETDEVEGEAAAEDVDEVEEEEDGDVGDDEEEEEGGDEDDGAVATGVPETPPPRRGAQAEPSWSSKFCW